jgi:hypothetical protein
VKQSPLWAAYDRLLHSITITSWWLRTTKAPIAIA